MRRLIVALCFLNQTVFAEWTSVGSLVAKASGIAADPVSYTSTATLEAGNVAVCAIASDNDGNGTDTDDIVSVTFGSESMTSAGENEYDPGAAAAGAVVGIYFLKAVAQQNSGVTISVDMSASRNAKAISCHEFTVDTTKNIQTTGTEQKEELATDAASLILGSLANAEHLWIRAIASETTNGAIGTPTASYTAFTSSTTTTGTEATSMGIAAEFIIATATTHTSDPTMSDTSADRASSMIALDEVTAFIPRKRQIIVTE